MDTYTEQEWNVVASTRLYIENTQTDHDGSLMDTVHQVSFSVNWL